LRISPRHGPAFDQNWFNVDTPQNGKDFANFTFMNCALKRQQAKSLVQHFT
jgi:hypothetical protein